MPRLMMKYTFFYIALWFHDYVYEDHRVTRTCDFDGVERLVCHYDYEKDLSY